MTAKQIKYKRVASFLYEIGTLRKIARSHRQALLTDDISDNISSHSYRATWIGWNLAKFEKADVNKVLQMCLAHDISEARSNDQNWINKKYVKVFDEEIMKDQTSDLPIQDDLNDILREYYERKTKEAIVAKDADLIEQILLLKEYDWQGNKEASSWLGKNSVTKNMQYKLLKTKTAKKLAKEILKQKPSDWWSNNWTEKRR